MKKKIITIGLVSVIGTSGLILPFGNTASATNIQEKKQEIERKKSDVDNSISEKKAEIEKFKEELKKIQKEIMALDTKALDTSSKIENKKDENEETKQQIEKLKAEIKETEERIEKRNKVLQERVRTMQENGGSLGYIDVLLGSESFGDFINRASAVTTIVSADKDLLAAQEEDKKKLQVSESDLNSKLEKIQNTLSELEGLQAELDKQMEDQDALFASMEDKQKAAEKELSNLNSKSNALADQAASVKQEEEQQLKEAQKAALAEVEEETAAEASAKVTSTSSENTSKPAAKPASAPVVQDSAPSGNKSQIIENAISSGMSIVGRAPYVFGGGRSASDIANRRFDCSSFVRWAYDQGGLQLGNGYAATTDTLVGKGRSVSASEMKRGDLVFFDTYKTNGHVGIYLGNGKFLNSNSSDGVSVDSMSSSYWGGHFSGVVKRVVE
ncbi:NlpC/P60 family protein [Bacillus gobiensis]|uniref:coiled-coil domain-containing protein n=1 Tax=Bacillus gobiensis TaxID=1441095 RepID=UPI003D1AE1E4